MFPASVRGPGICQAPMDVCKVPTPAGPVPAPFVNIAMAAQINPATASPNVRFANLPAANTMSMILMSSGNEGSAGGVVSGMVKGPARYTLGSAIVSVNGLPAARLNSMVQQNGTPAANQPNGLQVVPGVPTVLING